MKKIEIRKSWLGVLAVVVLECFFFRNVLGNSMLFGDSGDGKLCTLLAEHWFKVFSGKESFAELSMFWPEEGVIGYTDLLLGYGIIHSLLRALGINMYLSYKYTLIIIHFAGAICLYFFLRKKLKVTELWSVVGVMSFFNSNVFACKFGHTQLVAASFLPLIVWLVFSFFEHISDRKKKNVYAFSAITLFMLLLYTSWYIAFFSVIFVIITLICYGIVLLCKKVNVWNEIKELVGKIGWDCIAYVIYAVITVLPFAMIYIPVSNGLGAYSWGEVACFLPEPIDLINVTSGNLLLGNLINKMHLGNRGLPEIEVGEGFNLAFLLCLLFLFFYDFKKRERTKGQVFIRSLFYASIICVLLIIKLSSNGIALWYFIYKFVPGAGAIRAVARLLFFLHLPLSICLACWGSEGKREICCAKRQKYVCLSILFVVLFVAGIRKEGVYAFWDAQSAEDKINNIATPPEDCKVFYIIDSQKAGKPAYEYQLEAFEIATIFDLKTINGYSGKFPQEWGGIWNICSDEYEIAVSRWIETKELTDIYAYDVVGNSWTSWENRVLEGSANVLHPEENLFPYLIGGLEDLGQGPFSWSSKEFNVTVKNEKIKEEGLTLKIGTTLGWYLMQNAELAPFIELWVNNEYIQNLPVVEGVEEYNIKVNASPNNVYKIELKTNAYFVPKEIGINEDPRNLSLQIFYIGN